MNEDFLKRLLKVIEDEFREATTKFDAFHNAHEGYAVLLEEVDELWENVKLNQKNPERLPKMTKECIQVAAMAIRFLHDYCGEEISK